MTTSEKRKQDSIYQADMQRFTRQIAEMGGRLAELRRRAGEPVEPHPDLMHEAFEELRTVWEQLQVAEEELLQQSEELALSHEIIEAERRNYQDLFEFAPDAYLVTDEHGIIQAANFAAVQLLGVPAQFLKGKPLFIYLVYEDRPEFRRELLRLRGVDPIGTWEVRLETRQAEPLDVALTVTVARDKTGNPVTLRWLLRDISIHKRLEAQMRSFNTELERRVAARTAALEAANQIKDEALAREQAARREAEAANRAKDEFMAVVSHELRTPLTPLLGWLHLLRTETVDDAIRARALETMERNAKAQAQLVNDLLDVSRITTGKLRLDRRPIELASILEAALDAVRPAAELKKIKIAATYNPALCPISGDPDRLQQVILNLLSNAIKFTPDEGLVEVRLERTDEHIQLKVCDTGIGIKEEFLPYVFEYFRQADSTTTRGHGGLGLGLGIARRLVELHGGTIRAESNGEGQGATFTMELPLDPVTIADGQLKNEPGAHLELSNVDHQPSILKGVRVLVVDDESDTLEVLTAGLEQTGAEVWGAGSVTKALAILEQWCPDVLVSDIGMPGQDGYALIGKVRALEPARGGHVPALALTAYAMAEDRQRALRAGFQEHLSKPVEIAEVTSAIARLAAKDDEVTG